MKLTSSLQIVVGVFGCVLYYSCGRPPSRLLLTACCNTNVPFLLTMTSSIALIEVSNALRPSSRFIVVVVTTYVGGAIKFICVK